MNTVASATKVKTCAAPNCNLAVSYPNNLCDVHYLPGVVVVDEASGDAFNITVWYAEQGDEIGLIYLHDFALGALFGGRAGFEAELARQGFTRVRHISTRAELKAGLEATARPTPGKQIGKWSGAWPALDPWELN